MSAAPGLAIEGVIGVGKTTLARAVAAELGAVRLFEDAIDNPFLARFYRNRARWALACQLRFLEGRLRQFERPRPDAIPVVADHTLAKDRLFARVNLADEEWETYRAFYDRLAPGCGYRPAVTIYLKAGIDEVRSRIRGRARRMESGIDVDYLAALVKSYDEHFERVDDRAVVVVANDGEGIAGDRAALARLIDACAAAPKGLSYCNPYA